MDKKRNILIFIGGIIIVCVILVYGLFIARQNKEKMDNQILSSPEEEEKFMKACLFLVDSLDSNKNTIVPSLGKYAGVSFCGIKNNNSFSALWMPEISKYFTEHRIFTLAFNVKQVLKQVTTELINSSDESIKVSSTVPICMFIRPYYSQQLKITKFYPPEFIKSITNSGPNFVVCSDAFLSSAFPSLSFLGQISERNILSQSKTATSDTIKIELYIPRDEEVIKTIPISNLSDYFLQHPLDFISVDKIDLPIR